MFGSQAQSHPLIRPGKETKPVPVGLVFGLVALSAVFVSQWVLAPVGSLLATTSALDDTDGDGLPDEQEFVLGTSAYLVDSDGDGATDAMELALGTSPVFASQVPVPGKELGVGMVARGGGGRTYVQVLLYSSAGSFDNASLAMSIKTSSGVTALDRNRLAQFSTVSESILPNGAAIRSISIELMPAMVLVPGKIDWIAAIGDSQSGGFSSAATCQLRGDASDGSVYWIRSGHTLPPNSTGLPPQLGDQITQPIPPDPGDAMPSPGVPGLVCLQSFQVVGTGSGSIVITEITTATCEMGWAAFCDYGACDASVGSTVETVNPRSLLGG
jgi:hypothetical protein